MNSEWPDGGRTLIVGASGQVGASMLRFLRRRDLADCALVAARTSAAGSILLDLAAPESLQRALVELATVPLSAILCIAGWTHVDGCESDPARAFQVNAVAPAMLAAYARGRGVPFVYYSTDYLFDGSPERPGPYLEGSEPRPLNVYGQSKLAGERSVMDAHPEALVLRTAGVFGADEQGKNYVYTVLRALTKGQILRVPQDQISTPAYNADLARATFTLLEAGACGTYHACGPEMLGRLEFAEIIAEEFGLDTSLLRGCTTAELGQRAVRPLRGGLDSSKLAREFPEAPMRGVREGLADCRGALEASIAGWQEDGRTEA